MNAEVLIRSRINQDQLIDAIEGNKKYVKGLIVLNKIDISTEEELKKARKLLESSAKATYEEE